MADQLKVGGIGTRIRLNCVDSLDGFSLGKIYYKKPLNGGTGVWTAVREGTTSYIYFDTTAITDLDIAGDWYFESYVEVTGGKWHGERVKRTVYGNIEVSS